MNLPSLAYLERYRNEGTRTYSRHSGYSEAEPRYQPGSAEAGFQLVTFRVPRRHLAIYTANPAAELRNLYLDQEYALFCIHPQVFAQGDDDPYLRAIRQSGVAAPEIPVIPSSSTRTLMVESDVPHALKVHFPFRISRYGRKMRDEVIEQAVAVSLELENGIASFPESFGFLREVIGVSWKNLQSDTERGENWGYLVRDMRPYPATEEKRRYVPGFALYGTDYFDPAAELLLYRMIGSQDPLEFVLENLMFPVIRHWVEGYRSFGFMLEPHGQNVLLELDQNDRIRRIIHRDLSVGIDMRRRNDLGLGSDHLNNYNRMNYGEFSSITYDMFMGSHFFERVVGTCLDRYADLGREDFSKPCRRLFANLFPEHQRYMPAEVHYFSERRDRFNKPLYQSTGQKPVWRP